ncbi:DUF1508 domain-containing protein [Halonotius terrestris]|uniref:DUF1508 domain-containing protein n=1 Tax=Halonotius terrestris TaxID=2487750 RepID=A0A8J8P9U1_9EURY|nr:HVO_2922 family protein [Halonotius terrestris]TQQ82551.1 DUF1508 domain-containing protein [Halonotius terrestris]
MASNEPSGLLAGWYNQRIGTPTTDDEVNGYWLFVAGILLGLLGIVVVLLTEAATGSRGLGYALAALSPPFLMLGAIIRFPLRKAATSIGYAGALVCSIAVIWFVAVFPGGWFTASGNTGIIGLYSLGILLLGLAGALVPLLTAPVDTSHEDATRAAQAAHDEETRAAQAAHDEELAAADEELAAATDRAADLEAEVTALQAELAATRQSQGRFELFTDKSGKHRWRLRHRNGNVIADSGQGYTALHNAQKGLASVRRNALGAGVLRIDPEIEDESPDDADEPVVAVPAAVEEIESKATFETFSDKRGDVRWRLRHDNGNIIGDSGEGYDSKSNAKRAIEKLKTYVGPADYLWFDPTGFEVYRDKADEWRWRLVHRNGNILADSGEGYSRRHDASRAVTRLQENAADLEFEVYEDNAGEYRFRVESANGNILADSGEGYDSKSGAEDAVEKVKEYAPDADTLDIGLAAFEIYEDKGGEFRWRLRHRNGNILADSGEGYASRIKARDGIESVKRNAPGAAVEADD